MEVYRKSVRRYHEPGDTHLYTFSCYQRLVLLTDPQVMRELSQRINTSLTSHSCLLLAFVYMPEHLHLLVHPTQSPFNSDTFLKSFKQPFSSYIHRRWRIENPPILPRLMIHCRNGREIFRFWLQGGGHDLNIQGERAIKNAIDYIHRNPVRRGLAVHPMEWKWSSARFYLQPDLPIDPDLPNLHLPTADLFS